MKVMKCRLRVLMAEKDLTQQDLVKQLGMGSHTISKLYNNSFKRVDRDTVEKLIDYFQCSLEGKDGLFVIEEDNSVSKVGYK
jgi:putative transcriptional regulator